MPWRWKMAPSSGGRAGHFGEAVSGTSPSGRRGFLAPFKAGLNLFYEFLDQYGLALLLFGSLGLFVWILWTMDYSHVGSG